MKREVTGKKYFINHFGVSDSERVRIGGLRCFGSCDHIHREMSTVQSSTVQSYPPLSPHTHRNEVFVAYAKPDTHETISIWNVQLYRK